jgi:hypothetical protein
MGNPVKGFDTSGWKYVTKLRAMIMKVGPIALEFCGRSNGWTERQPFSQCIQFMYFG